MLNSIYKLKDKYGNELIRFRNHIEKNIMDIQGAPLEQQEERKKIFIQDSKLEIEDIKEKMRSLGFGDIVLGSLCATPSAYGIVNGIVNKNPAESIIGTAGLAGTIIATARESKDRIDKSNPLAYVALTAKKIGNS